MIEEYYGNRVAQRSGVLLMNHINEGVTILKNISASDEAIEAYRLHPIFQGDDTLEDNWRKLLSLDPHIIILVMEYRNIANSSLSDIVYKDYSRDWHPLSLKRPIKVSPLPQVNKMLIADKVQNWKDFKKYHQGVHKRSEELDFYFRSWIRALGLSEGEALFLEGLIS